MSDVDRASDWRKVHALGLPAGSVRALLALAVVGTVCGLLLRDPSRALPEHLESLLFVVLGHYFAARGAATSDASAGPPPLWLPRGSVRLLLVAALTTVGVMIVRQGGAASARGAVTLVLVSAFLLGLLLARVGRWWRRRFPGGRVLQDISAVLGIAAVGLLAAQAFVGALPGAEALSFGRIGPEQALAGFVGFYFGSRS